MNIAAYEENLRNQKHFKVHQGGGRTTIEVDGHQATYRGKQIANLSNKEKRKFETLVMLTNLDKDKNRPVKVILN